MQVSFEYLCKDYPEEFLMYFDYCRALRFDDCPNYAYLYSLFRNVMLRNVRFDWLRFRVEDGGRWSVRLDGQHRQARRDGSPFSLPRTRREDPPRLTHRGAAELSPLADYGGRAAVQRGAGVGGEPFFWRVDGSEIEAVRSMGSVDSRRCAPHEHESFEQVTPDDLFTEGADYKSIEPNRGSSIFPSLSGEEVTTSHTSPIDHNHEK